MIPRSLILTLGVLLAACSPAATSNPAASATPGAGIVFERLAVNSATPVDGALSWATYPGAVAYVVVYSDAAGEAPGTWRGTDTAARVSSGDEPDLGTIAVAAGASYRWFVYATDDGGAILASSEPQEFTCDSGCP